MDTLPLQIMITAVAAITLLLGVDAALRYKAHAYQLIPRATWLITLISFYVMQIADRFRATPFFSPLSYKNWGMTLRLFAVLVIMAEISMRSSCISGCQIRKSLLQALKKYADGN